MPQLTTGQRLTASLNAYKPEIIDNVINNNALLSKLKEKGAIKKISGGVNFVEKIAYASNTTVKFQGEYDILDTTPQTVLDQAVFTQKMLTGTMTVSELEQLQNGGDARIVSIVQEEKKNLISSLQNKMGSALFGDGTADGGNSFGGLQLIVADTPTSGTVGGIDRSAYTFWRNQAYTLSSPSATTIQAGMNATILLCRKYINQIPDLIIADGNYWSYFLSSMQTIQRLVGNGSKGSLGFQAIDYQGSEVVYDYNAPSNHMYFLNTNFLFFKYLGDDLFNVGDTVSPYNQRVYNTPMICYGNMTTNQARVHAVMK